MNALLITTDLMIASHVEGAAKRQAASLDVVSYADAIQRVQHESPELVAVDLSTMPGDLLHELQHLRKHCGTQTKLLAFGPHVHREKLDAARAAGCDLVLSRGEFHARVDQLLAG